MVIVRAETKRVPGLVHRAGLGSTGWDRSRAWTCVFSSAHSTTARSGGLWYRPVSLLPDECRPAIDVGAAEYASG